MSTRDWNGRDSKDWNNRDSGPGRADAADAKAIGTVDHYELLKELGTGGFGSVYLARDTVSRTFVAVKGLPREVNDSASELERMRENFALVSRLKHPNVASVLVLHRVGAVTCADPEVRRKLNVRFGDTLLVMDYAPGETLEEWSRRFPGRKVPVDRAIEIVRQIAAALDAAHGMKIVHRDVKPANVMVETLSDGTVAARVLDFGLAAEVRSSMNRVSKRAMKDSSGTLQYMAPEQMAGGRPSAAMDQYALAALFYELVTGDVPFASVFACNNIELILGVVTTKPPEIPEELPRSVRKALARALAKGPEERFATCGDFVAALGGKRTSGSFGAKGPAGAPRRRGLAAGILAAAFAAAAFAWWQSGKDVTRPVAQSASEGRSRPEGARIAAERKAKAARTAKIVHRDGETKTFALPGGVDMTAVYCEPGEFEMGGDEKWEQPRHRVTLSNGYWMAKYPVTQGQWKSLVRGLGLGSCLKESPSAFAPGGDLNFLAEGLDTSEFPVDGVSWNDCKRLVDALNAKGIQGARVALPTEAQWEYAARGGSQGRGYVYCGGNGLDDVGWYCGNSGKSHQDHDDDRCAMFVGFTANEIRPHAIHEREYANELGICGMGGNVYEWCQDLFGRYQAEDQTDPAGPTNGRNRVTRGGCCCLNAGRCRPGSRAGAGPDDVRALTDVKLGIGVRLVFAESGATDR